MTMPTCIYCKRKIVWQERSGKWMPMNPNGTEHAPECKATSLTVEPYDQHIARLERGKRAKK